MEEKIKIIDEIVKRHPSYGVEKGWSEYTGGMKDSGDWYFREMLDIPINELKEFLNYIINEENRPINSDPYSDKIITNGSFWMRENEYNMLKDIAKKEFEKIFFGDNKK